MANNMKDKMIKACRAASIVLDRITPFVKAGITTNDIDKKCKEIMDSMKVRSACLNYRGFPKHVCVSVNNVVCHGIPSNLMIKDGDILNIDVTVELDGYYGDTGRMFMIGNVSKKASDLVRITEEAMYLAIESIKTGLKTGIIGYTIENYCKKYGFSPVRDYCGHGIGRKFHMEPMILHFGSADDGVLIKEGMYFTVEPMINEGSYEVYESEEDGWTVYTEDGLLSAQWEHTILVTENGAQILTYSNEKDQI